ncbi:MAG: 2OG-Fe(II) oxygenase, partial [Acidobacteriota bacterium]|nr:2OG-Fe(II) oxygenase [Acidobacteriota bacterium]
MTRVELGKLIGARIGPERDRLAREYRESGRIRTFSVDGLLPEEIALRVAAAFPPLERMVHKKNLGQDKYVGVQMNRYDPLLEELVYAFQEP